MPEIGNRYGPPASTQRRYRDWSVIALISLLFLSLHAWVGITKFQYDAGAYWDLAHPQNILHFPKQIRGYFFPIVLSPARLAADIWPQSGPWPFRIFWSFVCGYILAVLLPATYLSIFGGQRSLSRTLVLPFLVALLMPGIVLYPLSDLPALALAAAAVLCSQRACAPQKRFSASAGLFFLAGFLAYGAYNTRTIYLFSSVLLTIIIFMITARRRGFLAAILAFVIFTVGGLVAAAPQMLSNKRNYDLPTPLVISNTSSGSLFASQLLWGISIQKYETTIDPRAPAPSVFYVDPVGQSLIQNSEVDSIHFTFQDYLKIALSHPLELLGIYGRHLVNGLDLRDGEVYLTRRSPEHSVQAFLNFLILYMAVLTVACVSRTCVVRKSRHAPVMWATVLALPVLAILPGAVETRFFIACHLAAYCALGFHGNVAAITHAVRQRPLLIGATFAISLLIFFRISGSTMSQIQYTVEPKYLGIKG